MFNDNNRHIYIERERYRERKRYIHVCTYMYIYIYICKGSVMSDVVYAMQTSVDKATPVSSRGPHASARLDPSGYVLSSARMISAYATLR